MNKLQADCVDQSLVLLHQPGKFFICQRPHLPCFVLLYTKTNSPAPILQARGNFSKIFSALASPEGLRPQARVEAQPPQAALSAETEAVCEAD